MGPLDWRQVQDERDSPQPGAQLRVIAGVAVTFASLLLLLRGFNVLTLSRPSRMNGAPLF